MKYDKIYLINLDSAEDRLEKVTEQLNKNNIKFERISAISGDSLKGKYTIEETNAWNLNAVGLTLTTIEILEDAIRNKYKNIFIFEDDAVLSINFEKHYKRFIDNVPLDWQVLLLNFTPRKSPKVVKPHVARCKETHCCQAYALHNSIYKEYLELLKTITKPIDEHTVTLQEKGTTYAPISNIVYHPKGNYSTLRESQVDY